MSRPTVLVIGGGIAGPVLALFLQRAGLRPLVCEAREAPADDAGAFLNLAPNGLAVLETLGLAESVAAAGTRTGRIEFFNHRGRPLGALPDSTLLIKRGALHRVLREAVLRRGIGFEHGRRLVAVEQGRGRVAAEFDDGRERGADLLVGCDGIWSATRRAVFPDAPQPSYTGVIDSGGFTPAPPELPADGVMRMIFGLHGFFGYQIAPSGEAFWFQNLHQGEPPARSEPIGVADDAWRRRILAAHAEDVGPARELIWSARDPVGRWPIYDLPTLPAWHQGAVCLIGDAAHATSPHAGQGASLALEDAVTLARCLRASTDPAAAFPAFERLRRRRVERLVREARRQGSRKVAGPFGRRFRDLMLPLFIGLGVRSLRKTYAYRVDWDHAA
jgi:2-polyprenyl-6-methoxyphenol hydroxylase-like FAD-dependent oxidoreductase